MHSYIFVRKDLPWPQVAVQTGHACIEMGRELLHPEADHPNLVLIGIRSEAKLASVEAYLKEHGVDYVKYRDKAMAQDTAIVTVPVDDEKRKVFAKYKLLKEDE